MQTQIYRRLPLILATFAVFAVARPAHAQTYTETVLYSFCSQGGSGCTDGEIPLDIVLGTDGNLYGTAEEGGTGSYGTVFKSVLGGATTTLYNFCGLAACDDGEYPATLIEGSDGNFYGITRGGGAYGDYGTVYRLTTAGALLTLYSFCGQQGCSDGVEPLGLVQGSDSNFYGVTGFGGASNGGTVFKLTPTGTLTTIYAFPCDSAPCPQGYTPLTILQASDGNFYGATEAGGSNGAGTIFKVTPSGALTTLYSFCGGSACAYDVGTITLVQGADGNLYGTAEEAGAGGFGTVFRISTSGTYATLYTFCSQTNCSDGMNPGAALVQSGGSFYGSTILGGTQGGGTIFEISPSGTLATLYTFCSLSDCDDGEYPYSPLVQSSNGSFYGTTGRGGVDGNGTLFEFTTANEPSSTALVVTPNPVALGQTVAFSVTVSGAHGEPTGGVTFSLNGKSSGSEALNSSGIATLTLNTLGYAPGTYSVLATYTGNTVYTSSQSSANLVVVKATPSIVLTATPNPAQAGQTETLTATVTGQDGTPNGTVNFTVNGTTIGSGTLNSSGVATLTASTNKLALGTYPFVATYIGNSDYTRFRSSAMNVVLEQAVTATTLTGAPNPVTPPASVTLIASVRRTASATSGVPTGTVTFYYGTAALGTITLNESAEASLTAPTKGLAAGTYPITVKYNGDADDATSTSAPLNVTVN